ncbi:MAG: hypothetical protein NW201_07335 [Gemmatimonadales bacterium]|nr:hypothetical protein [Gemmatimonadales bacterium]
MFALLLALAVASPTAPPVDPAEPVIAVDSARRELTITLGGFDLPNMPPMADHASMDHGASHDTPVLRFAWPMEAWMRGFRVEVRARDGTPLPRHIMHHMIMVNFDRRQLLYPAVERLLGIGTETGDVSLPPTIGVPLAAGTRLGLYVAWHNDTGRDLEDVQLRITMQWMPRNQAPRPLDALPLYMDVNLTVGGSNAWDVPPGAAQRSWEFTMPVSGRLLGVGGHLHDHGVKVELADAATGRLITRVRGTRDATGRVTAVERKLFGVSGEGIRLVAGRRYRVTGFYENPTGETLVRGAMAHLVGLFAPDDLARWPVLDLADADTQRDLASLATRGEDDDGHDHGSHQHPQ